MSTDAVPLINVHFAIQNSSSNSSSNSANATQIQSSMRIGIANGTRLAIYELAKAGMVTSISYTGLKLARDYIDSLRPEDGAGVG